MTIQILTIPDPPTEWAGWLESQLIGLKLRDLIEELRLLPGITETPLREILTEQELSEIRSNGLRRLPINTIRHLLASPGSLLELQEDVFINGGPYWLSLPVEDEPKVAAEVVQSSRRSTSVSDSRSANRRWTMLSIAATAAAVVIALFIQFRGPSPSGRILGQEGLLANDLPTPGEYLDRFADAGKTWYDFHPRDSAELIELLREVSNDCQILIDAPHPVLAAQTLADGTTAQDWFRMKCRNWKKEFDTTLASLESGQLDFDEARSQADKTMMKLINVLSAGPTA